MIFSRPRFVRMIELHLARLKKYSLFRTLETLPKPFPPSDGGGNGKSSYARLTTFPQKKDAPNRFLSSQVLPPPPQSEQEISRAPFQILEHGTRYFLSAWVKIKGRKRKHLHHVFRIRSSHRFPKHFDGQFNSTLCFPSDLKPKSVCPSSLLPIQPPPPLMGTEKPLLLLLLPTPSFAHSPPPGWREMSLFFFQTPLWRQFASFWRMVGGCTWLSSSKLPSSQSIRPLFFLLLVPKG